MPKRPKKTVLNGQSREFVVRLQEYFERECQNGGPLLPITQVGNRVADALGIGRATVSRIMKEKYGETLSTEGTEEESERMLSTPNKKRKRRSKVTEIKDFDVAAIRNHVQEYYKRGEYPSLRKLSVSLQDSKLFKGSLPSLAMILKKIGFVYKKNDKSKSIMECKDIAVARVDFIKGKKI